MAASRKEEKYVDLGARYIFEPVAVETWAYSTHQPTTSLTILIGGSLNLSEARETSYLYQRISVLVQRFNAVLLHNTLSAADWTD